MFAVRNRMVDISSNFSSKNGTKCECGEIEDMVHIYECKTTCNSLQTNIQWKPKGTNFGKHKIFRKFENKSYDEKTKSPMWSVWPTVMSNNSRGSIKKNHRNIIICNNNYVCFMFVFFIIIQSNEPMNFPSSRHFIQKTNICCKAVVVNCFLVVWVEHLIVFKVFVDLSVIGSLCQIRHLD